MNEFTTLTYVLSFPGMVAMIVLMTTFMKRLFPNWLKGRGEPVAYFWAVVFCLIAGAFQGKFLTGAEILETCVIWTLNSVIVWFAAMKAFDKLDKSQEPVKVELQNDNPETISGAVEHVTKLLATYGKAELTMKSQK